MRSERFSFALWALSTILILNTPASPLAYGQFNWNVGPVYTEGYSPTVLPLVSNTGLHFYQMWYAMITDNRWWEIYTAISIDGMNWTPSNGPVLKHGASQEFDSQWLIYPYVLWEGDRLVMYYTGYDGTLGQTGIAYSTDGLNWTKYGGNPVLRTGSGWESSLAAARGVFKQIVLQDTSYFMIYSGFDYDTRSIGVAVSRDGLSWDKYSGNPVLRPGEPGDWDAGGVTMSSVILDKGVYYLFYLTPTGEHPLGLATSLDGYQWDRYRHNPIFLPSMTGWAHSLDLGSTLLEQDTLKYWFSISLFGSLPWNVGYATLFWPDTMYKFLTGVTTATAPLEFAVHPAYPNPFNPSTQVSYLLNERVRVSVRIFNMLGQEVATLSDESQEAGPHTVRWSPGSIASGVYLCRIAAGKNVSTQRLLYLR